MLHKMGLHAVSITTALALAIVAAAAVAQSGYNPSIVTQASAAELPR